MKVLIVGGYGVFGSRLARLLVRDGHEVTIGGRTQAKAEKLAEDLGCSAMVFDRGGDLSELSGFQAVVDAAGPFHAYGEGRYRLVEAAIAARTHYLDLSDNADFCSGIAAYDAEAKAACVCAVSGLSSVPALSSAAVRALAGDAMVKQIDVAILPGNRSARGLSVMHSILEQAGRPYPVWQQNNWKEETGWSSPKTYVLLDGGKRQAWQIQVPDNALFPDFFGAETVTFRAGLELWIMRYSLASFAFLRRFVPIPINTGVVRFFRLLAGLLAPFGTDTGGMSVRILTQDGEYRLWRLFVQEGDGPFIPAISARALLRRDTLLAGAGPALAIISLEEAEAAMGDLNVTTKVDAECRSPLVQKVLGEAFEHLPCAIRQTHLVTGVGRWSGGAEVQRGRGWISQLIATIFRFPPATDGVAVSVIKSEHSRGETWTRRFGNHEYRSSLGFTPAGLTERFGLFTFLLDLRVRGESLHIDIKNGSLGPIPLPGWLMPRTEAREYDSDGVFHFDIAIFAPLTDGLVVRYKGWLKPEKIRLPISSSTPIC